MTDRREGNRPAVGFAVGTGRCGTKFIAQAMAGIHGVDAHHEINPLNETFHRYCQWYGLPVDDQGFLHCKAGEIARARTSDLFFEASAYLSLSIHALAHRFDAKFVLMVRDPVRVVNSYLRKGWYLEPPIIGDPDLAAGYQPTPQFHHFLGRLMPRGAALGRWAGLTRVGKLAWYWRTLNEAVVTQFETLPTDRWRIQRLETLDYPAFADLCHFLGANAVMPKAAFEAIADERPNHFTDLPQRSQWSDVENQEFLAEIGNAAGRFGYEVAENA